MALRNNDYVVYRKYMGGVERQLYDSILDGLLSHRRNIVLGNVSFDDAFNLYMAVRNDHPTIISAGSSVKTKEENGVLSVEPAYTMASREESSKWFLIEKALQDVDRLICEGDSQWEIAEKIYGFCIDKCEYTRNPAADMSSVLVDNNASCAGYAAAIAFLCQRYEIPCTSVYGYASKEDDNGEIIEGNHAWNIAQIGGQWMYVDATWGDPIMNGKPKGHILWDYLGVGRELSSTHRLDENMKKWLPVVEDVHGWHARHGLYISPYSTQKTEKAIIDYANSDIDGAIRNGVAQVSVRLENREPLDAVKSELCDHGGAQLNLKPLYNSAGAIAENFRWSTNKPMNTLTISYDLRRH